MPHLPSQPALCFNHPYSAALKTSRTWRQARDVTCTLNCTKLNCVCFILALQRGTEDEPYVAADLAQARGELHCCFFASYLLWPFLPSASLDCFVQLHVPAAPVIPYLTAYKAAYACGRACKAAATALQSSCSLLSLHHLVAPSNVQAQRELDSWGERPAG